jgi:hypothetical protein
MTAVGSGSTAGVWRRGRTLRRRMRPAILLWLWRAMPAHSLVCVSLSRRVQRARRSCRLGRSRLVWPPAVLSRQPALPSGAAASVLPAVMGAKEAVVQTGWTSCVRCWVLVCGRRVAQANGRFPSQPSRGWTTLIKRRAPAQGTCWRGAACSARGRCGRDGLRAGRLAPDPACGSLDRRPRGGAMAGFAGRCSSGCARLPRYYPLAFCLSRQRMGCRARAAGLRRPCGRAEHP